MKTIRGFPLSAIKGKSIQFDLIKRFFMTAMLSGLLMIVGVLIFSVVWGRLFRSDFLVSNFGFDFFSTTYFFILGGLVLCGFVASVLATVIVGFPVARMMKQSLQVIRDANEKVSRGNLAYRLTMEGYGEIEDISNQFNRMADRTEKQVESLQRLVNENKKLLEGAEEAASSEERRKIARELHDAISQQLFAISTTVSAVSKMMDTKPEEAKRYFTVIEKMVNDAQQELRALIMHLRPVSLEEHSLKEGIQNLLDELVEKHQHMTISTELQNIEGIPHGIENNIFRVTQEAISNIMRHSKATSFSVRLFQKEKVMHLIIEDNGIGIKEDNRKKTSYGMLTMKERIEEVGGRFDVITFPGKGTRIEVRVPIGLQSIFKN